MPAIDDCEPQVIRALEKDGWQLDSRPYSIPLMDTVVFADLLLRKTDTDAELLVVEVKCFPASRTPLEHFYQAVGQYQMYRLALKRLSLDIPIVLSIPQPIYETFVQVEADAQAVLKDATIKVVVIDLESEEVVTWLN